MKKVLGIFALVMLVFFVCGMLSSCSQEYCPTYSGYSTGKHKTLSHKQATINYGHKMARK